MSRNVKYYKQLGEDRVVTVNSLGNLRVKKLKDKFNRQGKESCSSNLNSDVKRKLQEENELILIASEVFDTIRKYYFKPHFVILTDEKGKILKVSGCPKLLSDFRENDIVTGNSLDLYNTGINALSLSMSYGTVALVDGDEHQLPFFQKFISLCSSIKCGYIGYLVLFVKRGEDIEVARGLLKYVVDYFEKKIGHHFYEINNAEVLKKLQKYKLSPREVEIGVLWLQDISVAEIASKLFLTEGTVRNYTKSIYRKTGTRSKSHFIVKFVP